MLTFWKLVIFIYKCNTAQHLKREKGKTYEQN